MYVCSRSLTMIFFGSCFWSSARENEVQEASVENWRKDEDEARLTAFTIVNIYAVSSASHIINWN